MLETSIAAFMHSSLYKNHHYTLNQGCFLKPFFAQPTHLNHFETLLQVLWIQVLYLNEAFLNMRQTLLFYCFRIAFVLSFSKFHKFMKLQKQPQHQQGHSTHDAPTHHSKICQSLW